MSSQKLSPDDIKVRIWAFVVIMVTLILTIIVVSLLYSVTFVTQPIKSMAPIDQAYTKMLNDIVLLIVGGIGGIMGEKGIGVVANALGTTPTPCQPTPYVPPASGALPVWVNPPLDETWVPPPPPTTPPDLLESDDERAVLAAARAEQS